MSRYNALKAAAQWFSAIAHRLAVMLASIEDSVATATRKAELAVWDVEQRIHDKALSAANQLANTEHMAIIAAHEKVQAEVAAAQRRLMNARAVLAESCEQVHGKIDAVYDELSRAIELHS